MTKTTKVIAALGVVAGLGVAALPLSSYAADLGTGSVSGNVKIETEIMPAIAMKIQSNNDFAYTEATPTGTENPSTEGWYEKNADGSYALSTDTTVTSGDTYYIKGAASYGFIGYEPDSAKVSTDPDAIAGPSFATGLQLSANQNDLTTLWSTIEVRSNTGKFKVVLNDNDEDTALRLNGNKTHNDANEFIQTQDGEPQPATAGWAVSVAGDTTTWVAMPANNGTPITVVASGENTTNPLEYSAKQKVNYGVASGVTKTGTYSDLVTYTATAQ